MRTLTIGSVTYTIQDKLAQELLATKLVYECGDAHDLHLMPDGPLDTGWTTDDVEALVAALLEKGSR